MRYIAMLTVVCLGLSLKGSQGDEKQFDPKAKRLTGPFEQLRSEDWVLRVPDKGSVGVADGGLLLRNRGYILAKREVTKEVTMTFNWKWADLTSDDPNSLYADHLLVLLRSSGKICVKRAYESEDGLRVRIRANDGSVRLEYAKAENDGDLIKEAKLERPKGQPALAADVAHNVLITDNGKTVSVTVGGVEVLKDVKYALKTPGKYVGWGNREAVGFPHLSFITDVTLDFKD